jgi:CheY-like chemotaxis protein/two-component sensor histidine kinase
VLAAGVAHEINNPLAVVVGNLDLALRSLAELQSAYGELGALSEVVAEVREAHEAAERIRHVAKDLKLFAHPGTDVLDAVDVRRVIESSIRMAQNEIRHRARLHTKFGSVPMVAANESKLGQVFLNLIINAVQSITEGGIDDNEISIVTALTGDGRVAITVRDTGSGMTPEAKKKLFSPFFTTKPVGIGTGLGLSICHRIVSEMGGIITAESELGKGSVFSVQLEPAASESGSPVASTSVAERTTGRRAAVLVVDDEASIGLLVEKALDEHEVTRTTDPSQAIEWIRDGHRYDVIFCDLMMPYVTGMDFHATLTQLAPDQAAAMIFLTGGTFTDQARTFLEVTDNMCIDKPFDIRVLRLIVDDRVLART